MTVLRDKLINILMETYNKITIIDNILHIAWYGMVIVYLTYIKGIMKKIASNTTVLNTRVYNVWRLHIKNRLGFLLACSHRNIVDIYIYIYNWKSC